ncbi:MAG: cytochrome c-type biogenesis protein CcmH [Thermoleophilaceae bacterium]
MKRLLTLLLAAAALLALPAAALAQCPKTTLGDVEDEVMCPQCGIPLELATEAPQAQAERRFIEEQVAACRSKEEIKDALVAQFGPSVLALPEDDGFNLAVYLVPILVVLFASGAIALAVTRWRRARPEEAGAAQPAGPDTGVADPEDQARLEADMKKSGI